MKSFDKPIYVTQPFLPPLSEFHRGLEEIWESKILTNDGPILKRFETKLSGYTDTQNLCLFANGTLALQIGLQGLGIKGEVITTPFTFVATTHALYWNNIRPVFCDIEPDYYTIDPDKVEELITPWTTAILAVHVFGHPCKLEKLEQIARKYNLRLIYDAAHAFGVRVNDRSIATYGDLSMFSFHATKLFHSVEGGMLTFRNSGIKTKLNYLKNFGFKSQIEVVMPGTNAKMNEMQALMGSLLLNHIDEIIEKRREITEVYSERLKDLHGIHLRPKLPKAVRYNYAYMPIEVDEKEFCMSRDQLFERLKEYNIHTRRYFYPLICDFSCYKNLAIKTPLTEARIVADRILTLPIYYDLALDDVEMICNIIINLSCQK